jgi:hypothetical protein
MTQKDKFKTGIGTKQDWIWFWSLVRRRRIEFICPSTRLRVVSLSNQNLVLVFWDFS